MFGVLAAGGRTRISSRELGVRVHADGICKLLVETQGYACEEHTVSENLRPVSFDPFVKYMLGIR